MNHPNGNSSSVWAWARSLGTAVLLLFLIFASIGGAGVYQGLQKRTILRQQAASEHYARGLAHMQSGRYELAIAEFDMVLQLDPSSRGAQARLTEAQRQLWATPTPTPVPEPQEPTAERLYGEALACYDQRDWACCLKRLAELRDADPDYQAEKVEGLLYDSFYYQGQDLAIQGRLEEALRSFDQALAWRPDSGEATMQRERLALYLSALDFWGADWGRATEIFEQLHEMAPDYRDVASRLYRARVAYGDYAADEGDWCLAEGQYGRALDLQANAEIQERRGEARERCAMASVPSPIQPTMDITATEAVQSVLGQGTLALTLYDPELKGPALYLIRLDATDGPRWVRLGAGLSEPSFSPDGERLAARSSLPGEEGLVIMDLAGQILTALPGTSQGGKPTWSRDGERIGFAVLGEDSVAHRIYAVSADGRSQPEELAAGWSPAWGPEGWLAYTGCDEEACGIHLLSPGSEDPIRITSSPQDIGLAWSPDGQRLAYMSDHDGDWEIHVTTREGWVRQLTVNEARDGLPVWSPRGSELAFVSDRDGTWGLYLMRLNGGDQSSPPQAFKLFALSTDYNGRWAQAQIAWAP